MAMKSFRTKSVQFQTVNTMYSISNSCMFNYYDSLSDFNESGIDPKSPFGSATSFIKPEVIVTEYDYHKTWYCDINRIFVPKFYLGSHISIMK